MQIVSVGPREPSRKEREGREQGKRTERTRPGWSGQKAGLARKEEAERRREGKAKCKAKEGRERESSP